MGRNWRGQGSITETPKEITIGVMGFGVFGRFMCSYLKRYAKVVVYNRTPKDDEIRAFGCEPAPLAEVIQQPVVIIAVTVPAMEAILKEYGPKFNPDALVLDVASVKTRPVELMEKYLPKTCQIIATHPLFGPISGAQGIKGLPMVIWPVRAAKETVAAVTEFVGGELALNVITKSPEEHDREMAYVQALTFFIGRGLEQIDIPDTDLKTATYQHLFDIERIVKKDTDELFLTIQHENPYADQVRQRFVEALERVEKKLKD